MTEPIGPIFVTALAAFTVGLSKDGLPSLGILGVPLMALVTSPVLPVDDPRKAGSNYPPVQALTELDG